MDRGEGVALPPGRTRVGLPTRTFLFTLDQLSVMLDLSEEQIRQSYIWYEGRSTGARGKRLMVARNIAQPNEKPEWRVAEREFIRWMRTMGYRHYERGTFAN